MGTWYVDSQHCRSDVEAIDLNDTTVLRKVLQRSVDQCTVPRMGRGGVPIRG